MSKYRVRPAKIVEIREFAMRVRRFLGYEDTDYINVPKLGNQFWVYTRNGIIQDGGVNAPGEHRNFTTSKLVKKGKNKK